MYQLSFAPNPRWSPEITRVGFPPCFQFVPIPQGTVFVFSALAFVPRIFAYVAIDNDSGKTPALYFLLLSMSLSSNFARVPLAFVLLFLFAGSKYYNNLWRTTIQVPEVTSNVSRVPHHVRDFSSVDPNFSFSSKTNISNFQFDVEYCRRGATLWMSFKLNKRPCLYYMRRLLLILRCTDTTRGGSSDSSSDTCVTQRSASTQRPSENTWEQLF